jgi:hypothetical protein
MSYQYLLVQRIVSLTVCAFILSFISGCASEYLHDSYGVTALEGFNEPRRILVGRETGNVVIDADAFHFKPSEENVFYNTCNQTQPRSDRAARQVSRRFIVTDAVNMDRHIKYDLQSGKKWPQREGEAPNEIEVDIYKESGSYDYEPWSVVPKEFDAPPATDAQLASLLSGGYDEYRWDTRIPWVSSDGNTYQLKLVIRDPSGCRFYRTPAAQARLPYLKPVAFVFDMATLPIQAVGVFVLIAIFGI